MLVVLDGEEQTENAPAESLQARFEAMRLRRVAAQQRLAAADALDGAEDKVISNCYSCQLGMKGKGELAAQVNDFAAHFCSEGCRTRFQEDAANMIVKIEP